MCLQQIVPSFAMFVIAPIRQDPPPNAADLWCGLGQSRYRYMQKDTSVQKALKVIQLLQLRREPR